MTEGWASAQGAIWGAKGGALAGTAMVAALGLTGPAGGAVILGVALAGAIIGSETGRVLGRTAKEFGKGAGRWLVKKGSGGGKLFKGGVKAIGKVFG